MLYDKRCKAKTRALLPKKLTWWCTRSRGGGRGSSGSSFSQPVETGNQTQAQSTQIVSADSGESVVGTNSRGFISGDFSDSKKLKLIITGDLIKELEFNYEEASWLPEWGLKHQTFIGSAPAHRVLMDEHILWVVDSVSDDSIEISLDTSGLAELYLDGLHDLEIVTPKGTKSFKIRVSNLNSPSVEQLQPEMANVEVVENENQVQYLKITGSSLMISPQWVSVKIDGEQLFVEQASVFSDNTFVSWVPINEGFQISNNHSIQYITPFGQSLYNYNKDN